MILPKDIENLIFDYALVLIHKQKFDKCLEEIKKIKYKITISMFGNIMSYRDKIIYREYNSMYRNYNSNTSSWIPYKNLLISYTDKTQYYKFIYSNGKSSDVKLYKFI